jgi:cell wall assembly regulator SMI1
MTKSLAQSTRIIDEYTHRLKRPTRSLYDPGASIKAIVDPLRQRGLHVSDELIALYSWHNGTHADEETVLGDMHIMPGYYFLSLEEALATYDEFVNTLNKNPAWFPLLSDGAGGYAFLDCSASETQPIYDFMFDEPDHKVIFCSIEDMLRTFAEAYVRGVFFVGEDGFLDMDSSEYDELAAEMNPNANYWSAI